MGKGRGHFLLHRYRQRPRSGHHGLYVNASLPDAGDVFLFQVSGPDGVWVADAAFDGSGPQARFNEASARLEVDSDGDGAANFQIDLTGFSQVDQLTANDFLFA